MLEKAELNAPHRGLKTGDKKVSQVYQIAVQKTKSSTDCAKQSSMV